MKKIVSVLTATRSEFGLLKPLITKLNRIEELDIRIAVTGMHLCAEYGFTYQEIEQDGFAIDKKIEILSDMGSAAAVSKAMGCAMIGFGEYFEELKPDLLIVLGDRYETLAVCCAAINANIPIAHLYGGETTEGAIDDSIRHAITKMSYLHFASTAEYRKRVIQLGEDPMRVHTVGALGIENIKNTKLLSKEELKQSTGIDTDKPYAVVTFHPVTLEKNSAEIQFANLLKAIDRHKDYQYVFTKANADTEGVIINRMIDEYVTEHDNAIGFSSLGMLRYLSALSYTSMVIGNSSSGLLEAPSYGVPTINIGDRQKGRMQSTSVINCVPEVNAISGAIAFAGSKEFIEKANTTVNLYGDGNSSEKIKDVITAYLLDNRIALKKKFYDINFNE